MRNPDSHKTNRPGWRQMPLWRQPEKKTPIIQAFKITSSNQLSPREKDVVRLLAFEHSVPEIGQILYISANTVISHRKSAQRKLGVRNTAGMIRKAFELGILKVL